MCVHCVNIYPCFKTFIARNVLVDITLCYKPKRVSYMQADNKEKRQQLHYVAGKDILKH